MTEQEQIVNAPMWIFLFWHIHAGRSSGIWSQACSCMGVGGGGGGVTSKGPQRPPHASATAKVGILFMWRGCLGRRKKKVANTTVWHLQTLLPPLAGLNPGPRCEPQYGPFLHFVRKQIKNKEHNIPRTIRFETWNLLRGRLKPDNKIRRYLFSLSDSMIQWYL